MCGAAAAGARLAVLDEANVRGVLAEAATAHVDAVLADETTAGVADAAAARAGGVLLGVSIVRVRFINENLLKCTWRHLTCEAPPSLRQMMIIALDDDERP